MTWPTNGIFANAVSSITGTVDAALSGISVVEVKITTNNATGPWWNGAAYVFSETWSTATATGGAWEFPGARLDVLSGAFADHRRYFIYSRVTDNAGNIETVPTVFAFTYDATPPALAISVPSGPPSPPFYSNNAASPASTRLITLASGTVSDAGPLQSSPREVWVAVSSGLSENVWWSDATRSFSVNQAGVYWSTQVYISGRRLELRPGGVGRDGLLRRRHLQDIHARARRAGNWVNDVTAPAASAAGQTQQFKYDISRYRPIPCQHPPTAPMSRR